MRCQACNTDNPPTATVCGNCQTALPGGSRKVRRRNDTPAEIADNPRVREYDGQVWRLFRLWSWSLIPVVGLVIGPISAILAWKLIRRVGLDPAFTAKRGAQVTMALGVVTGATNWIGLGLMAWGLYLRQ